MRFPPHGSAPPDPAAVGQQSWGRAGTGRALTGPMRPLPGGDSKDSLQRGNVEMVPLLFLGRESLAGACEEDERQGVLGETGDVQPGDEERFFPGCRAGAEQGGHEPGRPPCVPGLVRLCNRGAPESEPRWGLSLLPHSFTSPGMEFLLGGVSDVLGDLTVLPGHNVC